MRVFPYALLVLSVGCSLPMAAQKQIWGIVGHTPDFPHGSIFRTDSNAMALEYVRAFDGEALGSPLTFSGLHLANNGLLYGTTQSGGSAQHGVLYKYDPVTDSLVITVNFGSPQYPYWTGLYSGFGNTLIDGGPGRLYGYTNPEPIGSVFRYDMANDSISLVSTMPVINYNGTLYPRSFWGDLCKASNGKIYAGVGNTTPYVGGIAQVDPQAQNYTTVFQYSDPTLGYPQNGSYIEYNGKLYSNTFRGGPGENGIGEAGRSVVMQFDPVTHVYTKLLNFNDSIRNAALGFIDGGNGVFYGVATAADTTGATFFQWQVLYSYSVQENALTLLHALPSAELFPVTGAAWWGLLASSNGKLFGSFSNGLFEYDLATDVLTLRSPMLENGTGYGALTPLIEICRKPNYKPRATTSFNVCAGAHFFYDLRNVNATSVVWRRNGAVVPDQNNQRLEFAAIAEVDEGVWTCTLTNECGVTEPPAITITVNAGAFTTSTISGDTLLCGTGDVAILTGNTGGTWSTGATSPALSVTQPGSYFVWHQQACGLSMSNLVHVTHLDSAVAPPQLYYFGNPSAFDGATTCPGASPFLIGDNSGGPWHDQPTGLWQDGSSGTSFSVQDTGYYYISNTNACNSDTSNIAHVFYPVPPTPTVYFRDAFGQPADNLICAGDSVLLYAAPNEYYTVLRNASYVGAMSADYPYVAHDAGVYQMVAVACPTITSDTVSFTVIVDTLPPPPAQIIPDQSQLLGCDQDTVFISSAYPYCYWNWQNSNNVPQSDTTALLQVDWTIGNSGLYQLVNYNGCGTSAPDYIQVIGTPAPVVQYTEALDTVCLSSGLQTLSAGTPSGGTYSGSGVSGNTFNPALAGIGEHTITYSYSNGQCTGYAQDTVAVDICSGVESQQFTNGILLSPNPNTGTFQVDVMREFKNGLLLIYDANGRRVGNTTRLVPGVNMVSQSELAPGVYQVWIELDGQVVLRSMVVHVK